MAMFNKVVLMGNLARKPEVRVTGDLPVARTAIAVNRKYKDKEDTMFIDIVIFGKMADALAQYADKGTQILIEGRLAQNTWDQDGQKRSKHEIVVENFQLIGSKRDRVESGNTRNSGNASADDEIPF